MKFRFTGYHKFLDPDGYPAVAPPWGTLNAINLNTGEYVWKIPFGEYPELAAKGQKNTGTENYGGPPLPPGGAPFISATHLAQKNPPLHKYTDETPGAATPPPSRTTPPPPLSPHRPHISLPPP